MVEQIPGIIEDAMDSWTRKRNWTLEIVCEMNDQEGHLHRSVPILNNLDDDGLYLQKSSPQKNVNTYSSNTIFATKHAPRQLLRFRGHILKIYVRETWSN